jgi:ABC-type glycerol-3-phosphate transport system substrate-binding protein
VRRLALLGVALVLAACGGGTDEKPDAAAPADGIENLDSILALRSDFEADAGKPRLVILFSPT